jgi:hypothetical protein
MQQTRAKVRTPELMEDERSALLARLQNLDPRAKSQPGYRTALSLLNSKFRKASIGARVAVLQAATFMTEVLEKLPPM